MLPMMASCDEDRTQVISAAELEAHRRRLCHSATMLPSEADIEATTIDSTGIDLLGPFAQLSKGSAMSQEPFSDFDPKPVSQFPEARRFIEPETPATIKKGLVAMPPSNRNPFVPALGNPFRANPFGGGFGGGLQTTSMTQLFQPTQVFDLVPDKVKVLNPPSHIESQPMDGTSPPLLPVTSSIRLDSPLACPSSSQDDPNGVPLQRYISMAESQEKRHGRDTQSQPLAGQSPARNEDSHWNEEFMRETSVERTYKRRKLNSNVSRSNQRRCHTVSAPPSPGPTLLHLSSVAKSDSPRSSPGERQERLGNGIRSDPASSLVHLPLLSQTDALLVAHSSGDAGYPIATRLPTSTGIDAATVSLHVADSQPLPQSAAVDPSGKSSMESQVVSGSQSPMKDAGHVHEGSSSPIHSAKLQHHSYTSQLARPLKSTLVNHAPMFPRHHTRSRSELNTCTLTQSRSPSRNRTPFTSLTSNPVSTQKIVPETAKKPNSTLPGPIRIGSPTFRAIEHVDTNQQVGGCSTSLVERIGISGVLPDGPCGPAFDRSKEHAISAEGAPEPQLYAEPNNSADTCSQVRTFASLAGSITPEPDSPLLPHHGFSQTEDAAFARVIAAPDPESPVRRPRPVASRSRVRRLLSTNSLKFEDELESFVQNPVVSPPKKLIKARTSRASIQRVIAAKSTPEVVPSNRRLTRRSEQAQEVSVPVQPFTESPPTSVSSGQAADETFASEIALPNRVLAKFRGTPGHWYPAIVLGAAGDDTLRVKYDDETMDTLDSAQVCHLIFNRGDHVKIDVDGRRQMVYRVIGRMDRISDTGLLDDRISDVQGWTTLEVTPVLRKSRSGITAQEDGEVVQHIGISQIYVPEKMIAPFRNRSCSSLAAYLKSGSPTLTADDKPPDSTSSDLSTMAETTPASSAAIPTCKIFEHVAFCLSLSDETKGSTEKMIRSHGGTIINGDFQDLFDLRANEESAYHSASSSVACSSPPPIISHHQDAPCTTPPSLSLRPEFNRFSFICLIVEYASRKPKYFQALALGIPCISLVWIEHCDTRCSFEPWQCYLLSAGRSQVLRGMEKSQMLSQWNPPGVSVALALSQRNQVLKGSMVIFIFAKRADREKRKEMMFIVRAMGAYLVQSASSYKIARTISQAEPQRLCYISSAAGTSNILSSQAQEGTRKRKRGESAIPVPAESDRVRAVDDEWLKQSLILGRLID